VLSWLLLAILVIIWAAFLLPSRQRSPAVSVEEFGRKMSLLAETNRDSSGRWVLTPRRDERFLGPRDRTRVRLRRRRRLVFSVLAETAGLTFLMGLFPPFRAMLYATGVLVVVILGYAAMLVQIRQEELERARLRRLELRASPTAGPQGRVRTVYPSYTAGRNGNGVMHGNGHGNGHGLVQGNGSGHGNGRAVSSERHPSTDFWAGRNSLFEDDAEFIDEDVHVIVRRASEIEEETLAAEAVGSERR
jgi:hypothetical protein